MKRLLLAFLIGSPAYGQDHAFETPGGEEFVSTFSIIAYDPATEALGVGVQSRAFRAGAIVSWAEAGVGAVATQASANQFYKARAMELLKEGRSPEEAVEIMTQEDPGRDRRQVAVIDAQGRVAAYTGEARVARPNQYAGHILGENYSVQGNTLAGRWVLTEMARTFEETEGELAERLMAALEAGQAAGGDVRGMQSGGILVVRPIEGDRTTDRWVDIRVDDADDPFKELRRLLDIRLSRREADRATRLREAGKLAEAIQAMDKAVHMNPRRHRYLFTLAEWYAEAGADRAALNTLRQAIWMNDQWKEAARLSEAFASFGDLEEFQKLIRD